MEVPGGTAGQNTEEVTGWHAVPDAKHSGKLHLKASISYLVLHIAGLCTRYRFGFRVAPLPTAHAGWLTQEAKATACEAGASG